MKAIIILIISAIFLVGCFDKDRVKQEETAVPPGAHTTAALDKSMELLDDDIKMLNRYLRKGERGEVSLVVLGIYTDLLSQYIEIEKWMETNNIHAVADSPKLRQILLKSYEIANIIQVEVQPYVKRNDMREANHLYNYNESSLRLKDSIHGYGNERRLSDALSKSLFLNRMGIGMLLNVFDHGSITTDCSNFGCI